MDDEAAPPPTHSHPALLLSFPAIATQREEFPEISYFKECHVVAEGDLSQEAVTVAAPGNKDNERRDEISVALPGPSNGMAGEVEDPGVSFSVFVFLTLALGAVFVVWRKSKKDNRLVN